MPMLEMREDVTLEIGLELALDEGGQSGGFRVTGYLCDARMVIEQGRVVEATGNIHMDVAPYMASRSSGQRSR